MAMVQLRCPETGEPIDIGVYEPGGPVTLDHFSKAIPCPYCGHDHQWTSSDRAFALRALRNSPRSRRVLVEHTPDGGEVTAFP